MKMSSEGLFSVVIAVYNRAGLIAEALDSVKNQSYRPIEIIVVDDGSTDETDRVVENWAKENEESDLSLNYFYQENQGVSAARNRGLCEIHGEYIQYLDSDDLLHRDRFQRLVETFHNTGAEFIQTGFESFDCNTGETIRALYGRPEDDQFELNLYGWFWANTLRCALTKSLVDKVGQWDESMACFEDRDYIQRAVARADKAVAVEDVLASARRGGIQQLSNMLKSREGRELRVLCEERLGQEMVHVDHISMAAKQAFASRLYALGFRSNAEGWGDLGKRCGVLADGLNVKLDKIGRRRRLVWRMGRLGGILHERAHGLKMMLKSALGGSE